MTKTQTYRKRDPRMKCKRCHLWMRKSPTANSPKTRRPLPHASLCTDCPLKTSEQE